MLKLRTIILFTALCSMVQLSRGQFDSHSPYSYYGIGIPTSNSLQNGFAMGGVAHALRDSSYLNTINPASYASLDLTQLVFGFEGNFLTRQSNGQSLHNNNIFINQFGLGVPIMHKHKFVNWGMFLGYSPYSNVGYRISETDTIVNNTDTIAIQTKYTGTGGLNKITWGNGFQLGKNFSFGFNLNYLFGTSNRIRVLELPIQQGYLSSRIEEKTIVNAFTFDAGIQTYFNFKVGKKKNTDTSLYQFVFGATYKYGNPISADFSQLGIQYPATAAAVDTFLLNPNSKGNITMPHSFGAGIVLSNINVWKLAFDFNYTMWSGFKYFDQPNLQFNNSYSFHLGTEYSPKFAQRSNEKRGGDFFRNIRYRAGIRYYNRFFRPDSNPVDEIALSAGLALPFGFDNKWQDENGKRTAALSYINLGFEGGFANSRNGGIVNESFIRFSVSLTLRDKWFKKFKYY